MNQNEYLVLSYLYGIGADGIYVTDLKYKKKYMKLYVQNLVIPALINRSPVAAGFFSKAGQKMAVQKG